MSFTVFDGLLYTGKPVLLGTVPVVQLQGNALPTTSGAYYYDWEPSLTLATAPTIAAQMMAQLAAARAAQPACTVAAYNLAPQSNYWDMAAQQPINDAMRPVSQASDWLFPCFYTFYTNDPNWWIFAINNIAEARRVSNRPLAPFLNPNDQTPAGALVDVGLWTNQLKLIRQSCEGIVLWGGWQQQWDAAAPWWLTAQKVLGL